MLYLLIVSLLVSAMAMPALDEKGIVDGAIHHNDKEVAIQIELVVPVDDNETDVQGLFDGIFHAMTAANLKLDETTMKACQDVKPVSDNHERSWKCALKSDISVGEWRPCVVQDSIEAEEEEEKNACNLHGSPIVKLLVTKVEEDNGWQQKMENVKDSAFNKSNDLVIVVNSVSNAAMNPFRIAFYSVDKPEVPREPKVKPNTFADVSSMIWPSVQNLLHLCNYTVINTACYFYSPSATVKDKGNKTCMLGFARSGTEFKEKHRKYCVSNYAFQASSKCAQDTEKCEESCRKVLVREQCHCKDSSTSGKQRVYVAEKRKRSEERHLWQCEEYGKEIYVDCECESGVSAGGIVMIVFGLLILVLTIVGVFTCYWLCFRQRKPAADHPLPPPPSMPEEAPKPQPQPLDPPSHVEMKSASSSKSQTQGSLKG